MILRLIINTISVGEDTMRDRRQTRTAASFTDRAANTSARAALEAHLTRMGVKHSRQRDALVNVFLSCRGHETADEVGAHVHALGIDIAPGTVRRMMELMVEWGVASTAHLYGRPIGATDAGGGGRGRLICDGCGSIVEFTDLELVTAHRAAAREHGFVLETGLLKLRGRCSTCRTSRARGARQPS